MSKFLAILFLVCVSIGLQIVVMVFGWGLKPASWWWIIGAGIFGNTFVLALRDAVIKD